MNINNYSSESLRYDYICDTYILVRLNKLRLKLSNEDIRSDT